jgi:putative aminopeptidase FrvX
MLAGHIDEIGFVVRHIDDKGFLKIAPVGGWWGHVLLSQALTITTRDGREYMGIVGSKPPHGMPADVRNKVIDVKDMFVDLGVKDKAEVELLGIRPGDMVTPRSDFNVMANPNYLAAKAWDDRIGAIIASEVLLRLKNETVPMFMRLGQFKKKWVYVVLKRQPMRSNPISVSLWM